MNFGSGNIGYEIPGGGPGGSGARNGLSTNGGFVVLGQNVSEAGDPAILLNIREIPYPNLTYLQFKNTAVPAALIQIGNVLGFATTVGINIEGNEPGKTPLIILNDKGATSPTNGLWSLQSQNDSLSTNDSLGFIQRWTRSATILQTSFRNNMSAWFRGFIWGYLPIFDSNVGVVINLTTQGQQSRSLVTNRGAAAAVTFTLPAFTVVGIDYSFMVVAAFNVVIQAPAGITIRIGNLVSAAGGTVTGNTVGSCVRLINISSTEWVALSVVGTWVTP
jgi:hypothetical protein